MRIGIVSDTHGELDNLRRQFANCWRNGGITLVHLGDECEDASFT